MCANQVSVFKYVTLIENVLTKQWCDKALRVKVDYEKLLPKVVEAFVSIFVRLAAGYRKSFYHDYLPLCLTVCTIQYSLLTG